MAALMGVEKPRVWTPPLRRLTRRTSLGFEVIDFATGLGVVLMPWQKWTLVHGLELLPAGELRFRTLLVLVARQNGKTTLLQVLALWAMVTGRSKMVFGTSTSSEYARESWGKTVELAQQRDHALFGDEWPQEDRWLTPRGPLEKWSVKRGALDTRMTLQTNGAVYKIGTASRTGGRSLSVDLGITDELREHRPTGDKTGWEAWAAIDGATTARVNAQLWALSNAGDQGSVVLNALQARAYAEIESGDTSSDLFIAEYSAPADCDIFDERVWPMANPALGYTIRVETLRGKSKLPASVFKTEHLCIGVVSLDGAIPEAVWNANEDPTATLERFRRRTALCVDVSEDLEHVALVAAAIDDAGRARIDVVAAWDDVNVAVRELPGVVGKVRPREVGWFPNGPAGVLAGAMTRVARKAKVVELSEVDAKGACQALYVRAKGTRLAHGGDLLLKAHIAGAARQQSGDGWRFARRGAGRISAAYAAAGAVYLAEKLPIPRKGGVTVAKDTGSPASGAA